MLPKFSKFSFKPLKFCTRAYVLGKRVANYPMAHADLGDHSILLNTQLHEIQLRRAPWGNALWCGLGFKLSSLRPPELKAYE